MKIVVLGGTGATGQHVIQHLLTAGHSVVALVRNATKLPNHERLETINETALTIDKAELSKLLASCGAVISCLGHNLTWRGMYGAPRMLVRDSIQRICRCTDTKRPKPLRIVLMNTTGNRNLDKNEPVSLAQHAVLWLLRGLLPPHLDNERAANYLRIRQRNQAAIEWTVVRPDNLTNDAQVNAYSLHPSPIRSAIFDSGQTSRTNVADFMSRLAIEDDLWEQWKGSMPVIYNHVSH